MGLSKEYPFENSCGNYRSYYNFSEYFSEMFRFFKTLISISKGTRFGRAQVVGLFCCGICAVEFLSTEVRVASSFLSSKNPLNPGQASRPRASKEWMNQLGGSIIINIPFSDISSCSVFKILFYGFNFLIIIMVLSVY